MPPNERAAGGLLALACGDALANGVEFQPRGSYPTITDMHSTHRYLPVGQWSDDTGLTLCLGESLVACQGLDPRDQMQRYYAFLFTGAGWPCDTPLIPGNTITRALTTFAETGNPYSGPTHPLAAGNGGLMRLLPIVLANYHNEEQTLQWAREATRTTHGAPECLEASELLARILLRLMQGAGRQEALQAGSSHLWVSPRIQALAEGRYVNKPREAIRAKGYVADTLEAALWCFYQHDSLEKTILEAANLGDDCDTVATITGQLAGTCYGKTHLPAAWLDVLNQHQRIETLAYDLVSLSSSLSERG